MSARRKALAALLLVPLGTFCLGALWNGTAGPGAGAPAPAVPALDLAALPDLAPAAAELRRRDCAAALADVAARAAAANASEAGFLRLVDGLYAHACEDVARAEVRLTQAAGAGGALEDWRLLVLADSAAARGHVAVARRSLDRLLADHPASPLRPAALRRAAALAWQVGDAPTALELVQRSHREGVDGSDGEALDELAWEIGVQLADPALQAAAGRRLLVHHPLRAADLGVTTALTAGQNASPAAATRFDWGAFLSAGELTHRARRLLAAGEARSAQDSLLAVPTAARDLDWQLLAAEALTELGDGLAALRLLDVAQPASPGERARLEWRRARAAAEAGRVRRGAPALPADQRQGLRSEARRHLAAVASQGADRELATAALRRLFVDVWDDKDFDQALTLLSRLRQVDPQDLTGARPLWEAGWADYEARNPSGAIGYWSELVSLYPDSSFSRNARYWTARAHEALGNGERAAKIYREVVAADTGDFYTGYALARLGAARSGTAATGPTGASRAAAAPAPLAEDRGVPWPQHPDFERAVILSDLGLDDVALSELAAVSASADDSPLRRRAALALEARILARKGERRESIQRIRDAFPALGGPLQATAPAAALRLYYPLVHGGTIRDRALDRGLQPHLVVGMVRQESGFDAGATSRAGARGLLQLMPATGREVAHRIGLSWSTGKLTEPAYNLALGTAYFAQVLDMFDGNVELALAGYNGGPYRIKRLWRAAPAGEQDRFLEGLPVPESRIYVKRILMLSDSYRQLYPDLAAWDGAASAGLGAAS